MIGYAGHPVAGTRVKVHVDCGCMEVNRPEAPIPPGGQGKIILKYRFRMVAGPFSHSALVQSNDSQAPAVKLCAQGYADPGVTLTPPAIDLGATIAGRRYVRYLNVGFNEKAVHLWVKFEGKAGDSDLGFTYFVLDRAKLGEFAAAKGGGVLAGYGALIAVSFVTPSDSAGSDISGSILVETQVPGFERLTVPVRGRVLGGVGMLQADTVNHSVNH